MEMRRVAYLKEQAWLIVLNPLIATKEIKTRNEIK